MSYEQLRAHFARIGQLEEVQAIIEWDQAVNMPPAAGALRARSMAGLSTILHELTSSPQVPAWVSAAQQEPSLDDWQRTNVELIQRLYQRATALPQDLVYELTEASKVSEQAWRRYREENDFAGYAPFLERVVSANRKAGEVLAEALGLSPYEALMDQYEPGLRLDVVEQAFAPLRLTLPSLREEVIERQASEEVARPVGPFPREDQRKLGLRMMAACGLDMGRVRLDVSHHPFCGGVPQDVRITTRYSEDEFVSALMGVLHEAGHAKYEQGLPPAWAHQPVGKARGMVSHESQSLLQEMQVCRGPDFLVYLATELEQAFPDQARTQASAFTPDNLARLLTRVRPGLIRVSADEVTYPSHILLRYDLERALIAGELAVQDLPQAWDAKMRQYLGLSTQGNDRNGCLQDIHWPSGAFGYFPLYTLGAMVAAQLFRAAQRRMPELCARLRKGDFSELNRYLDEFVWSQGSRFDVAGLVRHATSEDLNPHYFEQHLRERYLS